MKKKFALLSLMLCVALPLGLVGCSDSAKDQPKTETVQTQDKADENKSEDTNKKDENVQSKDEAKKEANPKLEKALLDDLKLSDEDAAQTRYYYENVDLDGDGTDEVLSLVIGPTVSGSGGTEMYILEPQKDESLKIIQDLSLINPPVYISNDKTGDNYDIIVQQSGGGAKSQWKALKFKDGKYTSVEESEPIEFKEDNTKQKLFSDDFEKDLNNGTGLYLKSQNK